MKRLLVISYGYAPTNMIGIMRVIKLVKYLARSGWQSVVVTPKYLPSYPQDPELIKEIPAQTDIIGTPSFEPQDLIVRVTGSGAKPSGKNRSTVATSRKSIQRAAAVYRGILNFFMIPDDMVAWRWLAQRAVDRAIEKFQPDAIFSSAPPFTTHLLALRAAKKYHLPWVADFRDEWTGNPFRTWPTLWHQKINKRLERQVLLAADAVTCVSEPMTAAMAALAPQSSPDKFHTMFNGFDEEDFSGQVTPSSTQFTITYAGNFYGHRSPNSFFRAVLSFLTKHKLTPEQFRIIFAGGNAFPVDPDIDMTFLQPYVEFRSTMPHRQAIHLMRQSSVLLLVISSASGAGSLTGKIFEYLASQRPILALIPEGRAADIIRQSQSGIMANPEQVESITTAIETLFSAWQHGQLEQRFPCHTPTEFSREEQSRRLDAILEKLTSTPNLTGESRYQ